MTVSERIALALVLEPVLLDEDGVRVSAPLPHQGRRAGLQHDTAIGGQSAFVWRFGQALQTAPECGARAAMGTLLQIIGKGSDEQVAAETHRRSRAMQLAPDKPQLVCRPIEQPGDFGFDLDQAQAFVLGRSDCRLDRERATARQSAGEPTHRGLRASCARRLNDTVDPAALLFSRGNTEPELLLQGDREDAPHRVTLPPSGARHFIDRCALRSTQIAITASCFDGRFGSDGGSGSGKASIAYHS